MIAQPDNTTERPEPPPEKEAVRHRWLDAWPARTITKFFVLPLIGSLIGAMIIGRIVNHFVGPKTYYVYIVGDDSDPTAQQMLDAANTKIPAKLGGVDIETEIRSDLSDPVKAESLAKELVERPDTLMVIGHGSSSASQRALPVYLAADPPVPVILTTDTNPGLLAPPAPTDDSVPPVFRLFPTDNNQASIGAKFIGGDGKPKAVWIVEDTSNPTYSHYLARTFLNELYENFPAVKVVLWSTSLNLPPYAVDKLGIDWVFFAGEWQNALILIRQMRAIPGGNKPNILLSDASADKRLTQYGAEDSEGVYLLHPLRAETFKDTEYKRVGEEAHALATALLTKTHQEFDSLATEGASVGHRVRRWLGLRRVSDARRALARMMAKVVRNELELSHSGRTIAIGKDDETRAVIRKNASFHVWQVIQNRFEDLR